MSKLVSRAEMQLRLLNRYARDVNVFFCIFSQTFISAYATNKKRNEFVELL